MNVRLFFCLAVLMAPLSAAGQGIDFGDDSGNYSNDSECDDPRFEGPGAYPGSLEDEAFRDASDCRMLFDSGQVQFVGNGPCRMAPYIHPSYLQDGTVEYVADGVICWEIFSPPPGGEIWLIETPYINGVRHGTQFWLQSDGGVTEIPFVNDVMHGTQILRNADGTVTETVFVNGEPQD